MAVAVLERREYSPTVSGTRLVGRLRAWSRRPGGRRFGCSGVDGEGCSIERADLVEDMPGCQMAAVDRREQYANESQTRHDGIQHSRLNRSPTALQKHAGAIDRHFLRRYYKAQAEFLEEGWVLSTTMDFRWPKTEGKRPPFYEVTRFVARLMEQIIIHDRNMVRTVIPLADFGAKRRSIVTPSFVARFMWGLLRHIVKRPQLKAEIDLFTPDAIVARVLRAKASPQNS